MTLVLLDRNGRFEARVEGPVAGNVLLRRAQYAASDAPDGIVRSLVIGKVANQRSVLQLALHDGRAEMGEGAADVDRAVKRLAFVLQRVEFAALGIDALRGLEGEAGALYFSVFDRRVRVPDPALRFRGRTRRPQRNPVNALLSSLYTLLAHDCRSGAEAVGFLHRDRPGRSSLALDLMEELRPVLTDRLALSLINRRQVSGDDFTTDEAGG